MGILRRIAIAIGIIIASFIALFLVILIIDRVVTFNEKVEVAYNSSYEKAYAEVYDARYKQGYDKAYAPAYDAGYQDGYKQGYDKGYNEGYQSGLEIGYKQGLATGVNLRNPTYRELMDFLRRDKTDLKPYIKDEYTCFNFSADVNNNAELEGIRAAFVIIDYPQPPGHAIVAFETVDRGLIFIEPQSDDKVKLVIGKRFHQCIVPKPGYYYLPPPYDDTVVGFRLIW